MTWSSDAAKHTNQPIVILQILLDSGTLYYSNRDVEVPGSGFYEGKVLKFGTIHREVSNTDSQFVINDVTTIITNYDYSWSAEDLQKIINRNCNYMVGFEGENISTFKTVFSGKVANFKFRNYQFEMLVTDATKLWLENDYGDVLVEADWPNAGPGVAGMKMPIIYGNVTNT